MRSLLLLSAACLVLCASPSAAWAEGCANLAHSFTKASLPDTSIESAEMVTGGTVTPPYGEPVAGLPPFCRVTGMLRPTPDSAIRFEVWLPEAKSWNHRILGAGNGGFAGSIYYSELGGNLRRGFATMGTDTGHQATAEDASWAYRHPEKIVDFGHRGLHLTTVRAKAIAAAFYGEPAKKAYFDGCSDGGREALMEAERYPADYDGILAGAPANDWTHLVSAGIDESKALVGNPAAYLSPLKLPAITAAVLAACDAADGLKDGIVNDPRSCHFDPATIECHQDETLSCLTKPQVAGLRKLYAGGSDEAGHLIFPGLMPGDEAGAWKDWVTGNAPAASNYVQNYFRYMVYSDPRWEALTANTAAALQAAQTRTAADLNATDPDLSRFFDRGGKLILYHGWNDPAISPLNTVAFYGAVQAKLGSQADEAVRLYMVPGMEHCAGGPGPSAFGQLGIPTAVKSAPFAIFAALQSWVEDGTAPGPIIATRYGADHKVLMMRPICAYPQAPQYNGTGDAAAAESFHCALPGPAR